MSESIDRVVLGQIYDQLRTSLLNAKYYGHSLVTARRMSVFCDIVIAAGATGSGVAGWTLWNTSFGKEIWAAIAAVAALLAIVKPAIGLDGAIDRYSKLYSGHQINFAALRRVCRAIEVAHSISPDLHDRFSSICARHDELAALDSPKPSLALRKKYEREVTQEIPKETLWWPSK